MNARFNSTRGEDACEETNIRRFCEDICRKSMVQFVRQGVRWTVDIDPKLHFVLVSRQVVVSLENLLHSALRRMPQGGHLDWTAVVTGRGLELEVADTGEIVGERVMNLQATVAAPVFLRNGSMLSLQTESCWCPQGGLAQTLIVSWAPSAYQHDSLQNRRAA